MSTARELLQRTGDHPVVSLFVNLDPSQFATAPARASQVRSLIDEAEREGRLGRDALSHSDRTALTQDLERLEEYLGSDDPPVSGARAHARGGLSQLNYERSIEADVLHHMRHVAAELHASWRREPFARLVLGGPAQDVEQFAAELHNDVRPLLVEARLDVDAESASPAQVRDALTPLLDGARASAGASALAELEDRLGAGERAVRGLEDTLKALNERRVETLVLAHNFSGDGIRCPQCGLFYPHGTDICPVDGATTSPAPDIREAAVEAAVLQDASVLTVGEGSDLPPAPLQRGHGIAALLRF